MNSGKELVTPTRICWGTKTQYRDEIGLTDSIIVVLGVMSDCAAYNI